MGQVPLAATRRLGFLLLADPIFGSAAACLEYTGCARASLAHSGLRILIFECCARILTDLPSDLAHDVLFAVAITRQIFWELYTYLPYFTGERLPCAKSKGGQPLREAAKIVGR